MNVLRGVCGNPIFGGVVAFTVVTQYLLVEHGGKRPVYVCDYVYVCVYVYVYVTFAFAFAFTFAFTFTFTFTFTITFTFTFQWCDGASYTEGVRALRNEESRTVAMLTLAAEGAFTKTAPLTADEWCATVAMGAAALPIGVLMRLVPVSEARGVAWHHRKKDVATCRYASTGVRALPARARLSPLKAVGGGGRAR